MAHSAHTPAATARLKNRLVRFSPARGQIHEAVFARGFPRLAVRGVRRSDHPAAPGLQRAVEAIYGQGIKPEEGRWVERIERLRSEFAAGRRRFDIEVSGRGDSPRRTDLSSSQLTRVWSIHRPWGTFLMRLARELRPRSCLELGTAIGISAAYQGAALKLNGQGRLLTVEGSPQLAGLARQNLDALQINPVEVISGRFEEVLEPVLTEAAPIDLAFIDAGKTGEHLLLQVDRVMPHLAPGGALVVDDTHWSRDMRHAWRRIRADDRISFSLDLWRLGACLLRPAV
jgi:predicted O-methyltransferase YrrM